MRRWLTVVGLVWGLLTISATLWAQSGSFTPSPYIYKIKAADCEAEPKQRVQSGFRAKGQVGIFTALHGVLGCDTIIAEPGGNDQTFHELIIGKVDIRHDVAVLWSAALATAPLTGLPVITQTLTINPEETYQVIGYPFGLFRQKPMVDVKILERTALGNLLPDEAINAIADRNSPAIDAEVFSVQAHLAPGHSGAPVLNRAGQVVGLGNGGLDLGRVEMGWAIPWVVITPQVVSIKVSQTVAWADYRRLRELRSDDSGLAFSYGIPEAPTSTPTATVTPTPEPTATPTLDPCTATVISQTGATQISLRESATGNVTNKRIPAGATVLVIGVYGDGKAYQVMYPVKNYRGWLPKDNLEGLSPACSN